MIVAGRDYSAGRGNGPEQLIEVMSSTITVLLPVLLYENPTWYFDSIADQETSP
jgi:hypothetical protein